MTTPPTRRERLRASTYEEIKQTARRLMAQHGSAGISLRAIAGEMGVVPSALYRYYASRDDLLTALIVDAFHAQAAAMEASYEAHHAAPPLERMVAIGGAYRMWALENRPDFLLIYGTPIPDYSAPAEITVPAASATFDPILRSIRACVDAGAVTLTALPAENLRAAFEAVAEAQGYPQRADIVYAGFTLWMHTHGMVILEVFGHLGSFGDPEALFRQQMVDLLRGLGWRE